MEDDDNKLEEIVDALPQNGAGSEEAVAGVVAADAAANTEIEHPVTEETAPAPQRLPTPRCPFCQSYLFVLGRSGVNIHNIEMGGERVRIFSCAFCECVLPIQVMVLDTPMIAAPGPQGGRLIRH